MAVFVVAIHTHPGISIGKNADFYITDVLTKIAVPYFFVTSGFFIGRKLSFNEDGTLYSSNILYVKHYLRRILLLYIIWSVFYGCVELYEWLLTPSCERISILSFFVSCGMSFLFVGTYYHMWYLQSMILAVIALFLFLRIISYKNLTIIGCVTYIIGSVVNIYMSDTISSISATLYYRCFYNVFCIALPFIIWGIFIARYHRPIRYSFVLAPIFYLLYIVEASFVHFSCDSNMSVSRLTMLLPTTVFIFNVIKETPINISEKASTIFRQLSTLIYFIHPLVIFGIGHIMKDFQNVNSFIWFISIVFLSIILAYCVLRLTKYVKVLKYSF